MKINASIKSLVERLCDFKIYAISVLSFIGSVCAPDKATLKAENHALQCTTAGPYNAISSSLLQVRSICGLGPDLVGIHSFSSAARYRVAAGSSTLRRGLNKVNEARGHNCTPLFALSPAWEHEFLFPSIDWTVTTLLTMFYRSKNRKLPPVYFWTSCVRKTLLGHSPVVPHESWDQSVVIVLLTSWPTWKESRVLLALGYSLASFASYVMGCVLHGDFTLQRTITPAVLDAWMSLTPSLITMCVPGCITSFILETCYDIATKKLLVTRLDHPGIPATPSIWYCGSRLP